MKARPGAIVVGVIAVGLAAGGLFFGLGGASGGGESNASLPRATRPPVTVAPPDPAVAETQPPPPLTIEEGVEVAVVPNVIGVSQSIAESRLTGFAVVVETVQATDSDHIDEVTAQQPVSPGSIAAGGTVTITIALQPEPATIPADPVPAGEFTAIDVDAVLEGDCANGSLVGEEFLYETVDCDQFHDMQLIERIELEGGPEDFDQLAIDALLTKQCDAVLEDFVGVHPERSALRPLTIRPNAEQYVSAGDRISVCALLPKNSVRIAGSARGSLW